MQELPIIKLSPPNLLDENIQEKISCIRGHRERIFQVYNEKLDDKFIFHNYGHGGAGWTFLFGCVNASIRQFESKFKEVGFDDKEEISVVGAGCYGLLTAVTLRSKGYKVKIVAKDLDSISSNKAAGFFFPRHRKCSNEAEISQFRAMAIESYKNYKEIYEGNHSLIKKGPKIIPAYYAPEINPGFEPLIEEGLMKKGKKVVINFGNNNFYDAVEYKVIFINPAQMMQELWSLVKSFDIKVEQKEINSFLELNDKIIFNCSGYGSKKLTTDKRIVPVQGHLITLKNQDNLDKLQYMVNFKVTMANDDGTMRDELIYFAPKGSGILGITFIRGEEDLSANKHQFDRILKRARDFFGI